MAPRTPNKRKGSPSNPHQGPQKTRRTSWDKNLRAALSGDCDPASLLKLLHEQVKASSQYPRPDTAKQQKNVVSEFPMWPATQSLERFVVGRQVTVFTEEGSKTGRILQYDVKRKTHLVGFGEDGAYHSEEWMSIKDVSARIAVEVVWAHIPGSAWWPALLYLHTSNARANPPYDIQPDKLLMVFCNGNTHGWVNAAQAESSIRLLDSAIEGDMMKRVANFCVRGRKGERAKIEQALQEAKEERCRVVKVYTTASLPSEETNEVVKEEELDDNDDEEEEGGDGGEIPRDQEEITDDGDASGDKKANGKKWPHPQAAEWVGNSFKQFSKRVKYPAGGWVTGIARHYSQITGQLLVTYDDYKLFKKPEWIDPLKVEMEPITEREKLELLRPKALSMTRGHDYLLGDSPSREATEDRSDRCHNCGTSRRGDDFVTCTGCERVYHPGCVDPPGCRPPASASGRADWVCPKCLFCGSCGRSGATTQIMQVKVNGRKVLSCARCEDKQKQREYCPICAKAWFGEGEEEHVPGGDDTRMLACENQLCALWVHAKCEGLSVEQYQQVTALQHPILSKEYYCPLCRATCLESVLQGLRAEDRLLVFAEPVTEEIAPTYFEVIRRPMDLSTMASKLAQGDYWCRQMIRDDFELMVRNALSFNETASPVWHEALRFYKAALPLISIADGGADKTDMSTWGREIHEILARQQKDSAQQGSPRAPSAARPCPGQPVNSAARPLQRYANRPIMPSGLKGSTNTLGSQLGVMRIGDVEVKLHEPVDPQLCVTVTEMLLNAQDAYYGSFLEACVVCGASGDLSKMLFCMECGDASHAFCVGLSFDKMDDYARATWRCFNCKLCEICGQYKEEEDDTLLQCELCDKGHHRGCVEPLVEQAPEDAWYCGSCIVQCRMCEKPIPINGWSCHTEVCWDCGGFSEKNAEMRLRCPICLQRSWGSETPREQLTRCDSCQMWVHRTCDAGAADVERQRQEAQLYGHEPEDTRYMCERCKSIRELKAQRKREMLARAEAATAAQQQQQQQQQQHLQQQQQWRYSNGLSAPSYQNFYPYPSTSMVYSRPSASAHAPVNHQYSPMYAPRPSYGPLKYSQLPPGASHSPYSTPMMNGINGYLPQMSPYYATPNPSQFATYSGYQANGNLTGPNLPYPVSNTYSTSMSMLPYPPAAGGSYQSINTRPFPTPAPAPLPEPISCQPSPHSVPLSSPGPTSASTALQSWYSEIQHPSVCTGQLVQSQLGQDHDTVPPAGYTSPPSHQEAQSSSGRRSPPPLSARHFASDATVPYSSAPEPAAQIMTYQATESAAEHGDSHREDEELASCLSAEQIDNTSRTADSDDDALAEQPGQYHPCISPDYAPPPKSAIPAPIVTASLTVLQSPYPPPARVTFDLIPGTAASMARSILQRYAQEHQRSNPPEKHSNPNKPSGAVKWLPAELPNNHEGNRQQSLRRKQLRIALSTLNTHSNASAQVNYADSEKSLHGATNEKAGVAREEGVDEASGSTQPLRGWHNELTEKLGEWADTRRCILCRTNCADDLLLGRLLPLEHDQGTWIHSGCAYWSTEVYEYGEDLIDVHSAKARSGQVKCWVCSSIGATAVCCAAQCGRSFHFPCAIASGCAFFQNKHVYTQKQMYCSLHRSQGQRVISLEGQTLKELDADELLETTRLWRIPPPDYNPRTNPESLPKHKALVITPRSAFRMGSLIVHMLGEIVQDSAFFHCSRTMYSCQILTRYQLQQDRGPPLDKQSAGDLPSVKKPLFRIEGLDNPDKVYEGFSLKDVYTQLIEAIRQCQLHAIETLRLAPGARLWSGQPRRPPRPFMPRPANHNIKTYGLIAEDFIGISLATVRRNIEQLPGAATTALYGVDACGIESEAGRYRFCFSLPDKEDLHQAFCYLLRIRKRRVTKQQHCARIDTHQAVHEEVGRVPRKPRVHEERDYDSAPIPTLIKKAVGEPVDPETRTKLTDGTGVVIVRTVSEQYRDMRSVPFTDKLVVMRSMIHGWGLFAKTSFRESDMVVEYIGEVIRSCLADIREKRYEELGQGSCYLFRLDRYEIVDATHKGNMGRFINHSCSPNCTARVCPIEGREKKIIFFAKQPIEAGEEITYNYQFPLEDEKIPCYCGARGCSGSMN